MGKMSTKPEKVTIIGQGAEAIIEKISATTIRKTRVTKTYRHPILDKKLLKSRTKAEAKILQLCSKHTINAPQLFKQSETTLEMEYIEGEKLRDVISKKNYEQIAKKIGEVIAKLHNLNIIHSDLTTSNMIWRDETIALIDFGLSYISERAEDKAVDLHLLQCALTSYHSLLSEDMMEIIKQTYSKLIGDKEVMKRLSVVQARGKNKQ